MCKQEGCQRKFFLWKNLKNHNKIFHPKKLINLENNNLQCQHGVQCSKFKTKRQKLRHHNKHESECFHESLHLTKLLVKVRKFMQNIIRKRQIKIKSLVSCESYKTLKNKLQKFIDNSLINRALFFSKFGYECLNFVEN